MSKVKLTINELDDNFKGIAKINGKDTIIGKYLKGEVVDVSFDVIPKGIIIKNTNLLSKSSLRVDVKCPVYNLCGGCQMLHIPYNEQLIWKQNRVQNLFDNAFHKEYKVLTTLGAKTPYHYRNKSQMVFHNNKGQLKAGLYVEDSHDVIEAPGCLLQNELCDKIIDVIKDLMKKMHLYAYDEDRHTGFLRHVMIKTSDKTSQCMVVLVTSQLMFPGKSNFIKALTSRVKEITTIVQNINARQTSAVLGDKEEVLYGKGYIEDILLGKTFRISAHSFYQINQAQCEVLYKTGLDLLKLTSEDSIMDCYCGVGTIGLVASDYCKKVTGVEIVKSAVNDAITNAKINNIKNVRFFSDDATNFMINMVARKEHVDCLIMDPPRSGSTQEFLQAINKLLPKKVLYISCNPETLVNDLKELVKNYTIEIIQPVDMFPETSHIETVVLMSRL